VKEEPTTRKLEAEKTEIFRSLNLLRLANTEDAPESIRGLDDSFVKELLGGKNLSWGEEGLFPESAKFVARIKRTDSGKRLFLESDLQLLMDVKKKGREVTHRAPFGLLEAVFPVRVRGEIVHLIFLGRVRETPFVEEEITRIADVAGLDRGEAEDLAATVPVLKKKEVERSIAFCARLCTAIEQALVSQLQAADLTQQLVQSERTHSLGTLSGGVAHHFNNLLSVILGYSSFVLNREKLSKEADDALRQITEAAQRGRRLTEEVLAFLGSDVEENIPCKLHETVESVLSLLESKTAASVRVEKKLNAKHDTVIAEPSSIRQIVFNLLTNAIDSMPEGGTLVIGTANKMMTAEEGEQEYFQLEVIDSSGVLPEGFDAELAAEGSVSTNRVGLKLSSIYGMVGRLDGTVLVSSEPGAATRVQILLPTVQPGSEEREEKKIRRRLAPSMIWVVDDDAIFREMCRQVLMDEGHTVEEASGGKDFMDRWRRGGQRPDLIIMDFSMPEYNGLQLTEWVRGEGAKVPVVLVSGFAANQPDIKKALRIRKTFFLQKPFSFREMADTVTVALGETLIGE